MKNSNILKKLSYYLNYPLIKPVKVCFLISAKCQFNCVMCNQKKFSETMNYNRIKTYIDQIKQWGIEEISFSGGEPLLKKKNLLSLVKYASSKGLKTTVVTNCFIKDKNLFKELYESGLNVLTISLDGSKANTHDKIREKGSFKNIFEIIDYLKSISKRGDFAINTVTTIMKHNYRELEKLYWLARQHKVDNVLYQVVMEKKGSSKHKLKIEDIPLLESIIKRLIEVKEQKGHIGNSTTFLKAIPKYFRGELAEKVKCFAGYNELCFNPDGSIATCKYAIYPDNILCYDKVNSKISGQADWEHVKKAWTSKNYNKVRRMMKKCDEPCLILCWSEK